MNQKTAVNPVAAATVLICRDSPQGIEVFMVVRHHQIDFASGALVFPGGKTDKGDYDSRLRARPPIDTAAAGVASATTHTSLLLPPRPLDTMPGSPPAMRASAPGIIR